MAKKRNLKIMAIRLCVALMLLMASSSVVLAQKSLDDRVNVSLKSVSIKTFFDEMNRQTGLNFICNADELKSLPKVSVNERSATVRDVLDQVFGQMGCSYTVQGSIVTVSRHASAQKSRTVYGYVKDDEGEPLPGVPVKVKGTDLQTITDANGYYRLKVPAGECQIEYSYIGMESQTLKLAKGGSDQNRSIRLTSDNTLNEVVVTGYQTISKERATGAYTIIDKDDLSKRHAQNLAQALDGLVAGMQGNDNGRGGKNFTIRGTSTMNADNTPLVVVDGFPVTDNPSSGADTNPNLNALERLNPDDIESITFLKDAAAASIWGARSANGVIVITTKKAKKDQNWSVEASTQVSVGEKQSVSHLTNHATSAQMINYERWCFENGMLGSQYAGSMSSLYSALTQSQLLMYKGYSMGTITKDVMNTQLAQLASINNASQIKKYMLKTPVVSQTQGSISGSVGDWTTRASLMYQYDTGDFIGSRGNLWNIDWNNNYKLNKYISVTVALNLVNSDKHSSQIGISDLANLSPYEMLLNDDGSYAQNFHSSYNSDVLSQFNWSGFTYNNMNYNLLQEARHRRERISNTQMRTQLGLEFRIIDGLKFNSKFQYESSRYTRKDVNDEESFYTRYAVNYYTSGDGQGNALGASAVPAGAIVVNGKGSGHSALFRNDFTFDKVLAEKHAISAVVGNEISNYYLKSHTNPYLYGVTASSAGTVGATGYVNTMDGSTSTISGVPVTGKQYVMQSWNHNRFVSFYGNVSYMYDERYGLSASARSDASNLITSKPKYRWSPLWSVGAMWNMANEKWMKEQTAVNRLTFRLTYGKNGNAASQSSARTTINTNASSIDESTGYYPGTIYDYGNPTLRWEKTAITNVGIDFSLLDNHIYGSLDYYNKKSTDVLGTVSIASVNGTSSATFNNAELSNRGFEASLGASADMGDFTLSGTLTYAYNKNKVTKLYTEMTNVSDMLNSYYIPGYPMNSIFTFEYAGMDKGIPCVYDTDGNKISINDFSLWYMDYHKVLHYQGTYVSPHTAGLNLDLRWKSLSLTAYLNGRFGGKMLMPTFAYNYVDNFGGKVNVGAQVADLMDANGKVITGLTDNMPLPTVDGDGNAIQLNQYTAWALFRRSLDIRVEDASYIYLSEIDLNYSLPANLFSGRWIKSVDLYGKMENIGLLWSANSKHYHPDYLPGSYQPVMSFTLGASIKF
jgi:TonB-linked SusC/RagA family outer membrane protein